VTLASGHIANRGTVLSPSNNSSARV